MQEKQYPRIDGHAALVETQHGFDAPADVPEHMSARLQFAEYKFQSSQTGLNDSFNRLRPTAGDSQVSVFAK